MYTLFIILSFSYFSIHANKISYKIDEKSDEEKLVVYSQIEDVLLKYDDLYYSIKLTNNTEYSENNLVLSCPSEKDIQTDFDNVR